MKVKYLLAIGSLITTLQTQSQNPENRTFTGDSKDSIKVMNMLNRARETYRNQHFDSVIAYSDDIIEQSNDIDFVRGAGEGYLLKGRALNKLAFRKKAIEYYKLSVEKFQQVGDHKRIASALNNWGLSHKAQGEFRNAIQIAEEALVHAEKASSDKLRFHILNNLGISYRNLALFKKAGSVYFESLSVLESEPDSIRRKRMEGEVLINLGLVYKEQKMYEKSKEILNSSRLIFESQGLIPQLATVYNNLAVVYTDTKDLNLAWRFLILADSLSSVVKNDIGRATCKNNLGRFYSGKKMYDRAIENHQKAIELLKSVNAASYLPQCYMGLGKTQTEAGLFREARVSLLQGLQIALKAGQRIPELMLYEGLIELHKACDELEETIMYYDLHSALSQELNDQQIGRHIGRLELDELISKRDEELRVLETEAALLEFKVSRQNLFLGMLTVVIILLSAVFIMVFSHHRLKARNKTITLEQKILRTQLNPHFIFNVLGAIQHYMLEHAPDQAANYLSKFSALMRSILESSRVSKNSLSNELENMRNYIELQSLRFPNSLKYQIEVAPSINPDLIEVPSLLIQPLLENAIEHGLLPKNGGDLAIKIHLKKNQLHIDVIDNGVGLNTGVANLRGKKTTSLGNTIFRERMRLFNRNSNKKIKFNLVNQNVNDSNVTGTKASVVVPF